MKRKQVKLSSFLSPDGPQVHETQPKKEPTSSSWSTVQKDDFVPKKRVLPNTIAKSALSSGYDGNYTSNNPSKTVSSFRPADRMDDGSYVVRPQVTEPKPKKKTDAASDDITLSVSQKRVIDTILARKSVFFTGAAGTGKSHVLRIVREVLESLGLSDKVTFTAPTGVAACNIRGLTIHAWAGVGE